MDATDHPIACSLSAADRASRGDSWSALRSDALLSSARHDRAVTAVWRGEARARLESLIAAENECCPFLSFDIEERGDTVVATLTFPAGAESFARLFGV